jgi:hypothetical protein
MTRADVRIVAATNRTPAERSRNVPPRRSAVSHPSYSCRRCAIASKMSRFLQGRGCAGRCSALASDQALSREGLKSRSALDGEGTFATSLLMPPQQLSAGLQDLECVRLDQILVDAHRVARYDPVILRMELLLACFDTAGPSRKQDHARAKRPRAVQPSNSVTSTYTLENPYGLLCRPCLCRALTIPA